MKTIFLFSLLLISSKVLLSQEKLKMDDYNPRDYVFDRSDPYNPTVATIFALVPGAGHAYLGEPLRALGVVVVMGGSLTATIIGGNLLDSDSQDDKDLGAELFFGGAGIFIVSYFGSIVDARRVAKQKNMFLREKNLSIGLHPSIQRFKIANAPARDVMGLTLAVHF